MIHFLGNEGNSFIVICEYTGAIDDELWLIYFCCNHGEIHQQQNLLQRRFFVVETRSPSKSDHFLAHIWLFAIFNFKCFNTDVSSIKSEQVRLNKNIVWGLEAETKVVKNQFDTNWVLLRGVFDLVLIRVRLLRRQLIKDHARKSWVNLSQSFHSISFRISIEIQSLLDFKKLIAIGFFESINFGIDETG